MSPQTSLFNVAQFLLLLTTATNAATIAKSTLKPSCAPGGNFNLSPFTLQLPTGSAGDPTQISSSSLEGCSGYQDSGHKYFYTESGDGALVMKVPGSPASSGCVTTKNSLHCRTELRESTPASWSPNAATNRLQVTLVVPTPDDSKYGTVIGQIHIDDSISSKPVCELYYNKSGVLTMGVEKTRKGGDENYTEIATVPVGQSFKYEIRYEGNVLSVGVNGDALKALSTFELDAPASYFKVGNYNQGDSPSEVKFLAIEVQH
ncbi:hypothetical protein G7Y89_g320 [Cudoniella acicularis]|uniref:Alginate lyase 2 domain-containing protein n=1 Tax=Cudoniella acicularis TaxID=354080 RepID=A0A8H4W8Z3_9HELO|nr:hypothetical protein G7Y89_g320 [Cudoniella acicularis]